MSAKWLPTVGLAVVCLLAIAVAPLQAAGGAVAAQVIAALAAGEDQPKDAEKPATEEATKEEATATEGETADEAKKDEKAEKAEEGEKGKDKKRDRLLPHSQVTPTPLPGPRKAVPSGPAPVRPYPSIPYGFRYRNFGSIGIGTENVGVPARSVPFGFDNYRGTGPIGIGPNNVGTPYPGVQYGVRRRGGFGVPYRGVPYGFKYRGAGRFGRKFDSWSWYY